MVCILPMVFIRNIDATLNEEEATCLDVCNRAFNDCLLDENCAQRNLRRRAWPFGVSKHCNAIRSKCLKECLATCELFRKLKLSDHLPPL